MESQSDLIKYKYLTFKN